MRTRLFPFLFGIVCIGSVCALGARHTVHVIKRVAHHFRTTLTLSSALVPTNAQAFVPLVLPPGEFAVASNPKVFLSPYTWYTDGENFAQTNNAGAYIKAQFTGSSFEIGYDMSPYAGAQGGKWPSADLAPTVQITLDGQPLSKPIVLQMPTSSSKMQFKLECLPQSTANRAHTIEIQVLNLAYYTNLDMWNKPASVVRVTRIYLTPGETLDQTKFPFIKPRRYLAYGDSITKGISSAVHNNGMLPYSNDATISYVVNVADRINAEYGIVAYGGTGYTVWGEVGVPPIVRSDGPGYWDHYDQNHTRLVDGRFDPQPDLITVNLDTNDTLRGVADSKTEAALFDGTGGLLPLLRSACVPPLQGKKATAIAILVPPGGMGRVALHKSVNDYVFRTGDQRTFIVDLGVSAETGLRDGTDNTSPPNGTPTPESLDGLHPNRATQAHLGNAYGRALLPLL